MGRTSFTPSPLGIKWVWFHPMWMIDTIHEGFQMSLRTGFSFWLARVLGECYIFMFCYAGTTSSALLHLPRHNQRFFHRRQYFECLRQYYHLLNASRSSFLSNSKAPRRCRSAADSSSQIFLARPLKAQPSLLRDHVSFGTSVLLPLGSSVLSRK